MGWLKKIIGVKEEPEIAFTEITDDNFEAEVKKADLPVMLFVWSNNCPHCHKMAPNVKQIASQYPNQIKATHTGSHLAPNTMNLLEVQGVPTLLFFKNGALIERVVGFRPESYLDELIQTHFEPDFAGDIASPAESAAPGQG